MYISEDIDINCPVKFVLNDIEYKPERIILNQEKTKIIEV